MSVVEAASRIAQLQAMLDRVAGREPPVAPVAPAAASATGPATAGGTGAETTFAATFASTLAGASPLGAPGGVPAGDDGGAFAPMIRAAAERHGVDPQVFTNLVRQESNFDPTVTSSAGARGLAQLMPGTAASLGVTDVMDPAQSLDGGARYLRQQLDRFGGDYVKALAAYNAGPGAVERYGGVPPYAETQHYVTTILGRSTA